MEVSLILDGDAMGCFLGPFLGLFHMAIFPLKRGLQVRIGIAN